MEEGGEMDGEEREEMSLDTDGGDETIVCHHVSPLSSRESE